jgi:diguanylate cyclase
LRSPFNEMLVGAVLFVAASLSIWLTLVAGSVSLLWPGTAIASAILIRIPRVRWGVASAAVFSAVFLANFLVAHRPWVDSALFAGVNVFEMALMVSLFRVVLVFPYPDITIAQAGVMTALFGIAIPGVSAVLGGAVVHFKLGAPFTEATLQFWSSHAIGACLLGPPIILFSVKELGRLTRGEFLTENLLTAAAGLIGCYLAIRFVRFPFVVMGLLMLVASFRLGGFGSSLLSVAFGLLITNLWLLDIRPIGLDSAASASRSLVGLPVIALLACLMPPIAVGLGSDARRAAVRALKASERRFRESMEHSPIGMLIANLDGVWGYTNLALQQMLGFTAEEFQAMPPGGPSKAEDWKESGSRWRRLLSGEIAFYDTVRAFQHKNGHWIWTHVAVSMSRNEDGAPLHLIAQIESLEARRLAEATLAAERERLNITLQSIRDAVITTDPTTHITYINAAAESLLGLTMHAIAGRRMDEVIHLMDPLTSKAAANLIGQSALHAKVFQREQACLLHRSDGSICYVTDVVSPVLDSSGALTGLVIVFHDATLEVNRARDLQHRALHDPLTNLSNRADFEQRLRSALSKARQLNRSAALLAIDLDRFKAVNDAAGHAAGDALLCKAADVCRAAVRSSDTVARLGGDEFAIILEDCAEDRAHRIGNKLLRALNASEIEWPGSRYAIGASIGLAVCTVEIQDEKGWLEAADAACYLAKRHGRGQLRGVERRKDNVIAL